MQFGELGMLFLLYFQPTRTDTYRFPNKDMIEDPLTAQYCENGDTFNGWIGPEMHFREFSSSIFPSSLLRILPFPTRVLR
jgi:hypothetical protein